MLQQCADAVVSHAFTVVAKLHVVIEQRQHKKNAKQLQRVKEKHMIKM